MKAATLQNQLVGSLPRCQTGVQVVPSGVVSVGNREYGFEEWVILIPYGLIVLVILDDKSTK
ncbi:hypothetical protein ACFFQF_30840 [Haladaptatus pallidirubidus]|uniref:Uncharacterized protein n=1 Tax=Haladaptatus pallidirubidus TaxID=1008152 RepID=A0AAV3UHT0_9EURY|nr:hypothetical protein [Haladaptatus pallidirubidus]